MNNPKSIRSLFAMSVFVAASGLVGVFGDRYARVIHLSRRKKQPNARIVDTGAGGDTTSKCAAPETPQWRDGESMCNTNVGVSSAQAVAACM